MSENSINNWQFGPYNEQLLCSWHCVKCFMCIIPNWPSKQPCEVGVDSVTQKRTLQLRENVTWPRSSGNKFKASSKPLYQSFLSGKNRRKYILLNCNFLEVKSVSGVDSMHITQKSALVSAWAQFQIYLKKGWFYPLKASLLATFSISHSICHFTLSFSLSTLHCDCWTVPLDCERPIGGVGTGTVHLSAPTLGSRPVLW